MQPSLIAASPESEIIDHSSPPSMAIVHEVVDVHVGGSRTEACYPSHKQRPPD